jgi:hypothetical protein
MRHLVDRRCLFGCRVVMVVVLVVMVVVLVVQGWNLGCLEGVLTGARANGPFFAN